MVKYIFVARSRDIEKIRDVLMLQNMVKVNVKQSRYRPGVTPEGSRKLIH
jgi:hypothetical protein